MAEFHLVAASTSRCRDLLGHLNKTNIINVVSKRAVLFLF